MISGRIAVAAVAALVVVAGVDAVRSGDGDARDERRRDARGYRIDLTTSRAGTPLPASLLRHAFPGPTPRSIAVSKVAVAPDDGLVAIGVSHVPGGEEPARAAIELWNGETLVHAFSVPPGSFSLGLWFAAGGRAIATVGWDERAYVYGRDGRRLRGEAYIAYETP